jgi:hypothetical protein
MSMPAPAEGQPKSRTWLIVVIAVVVFCCLCSLCSVLSWYLYTSGDQLFGLTLKLAAGAI